MPRPKKGYTKSGAKIGRPRGTKNKRKKRNIPVPPPAEPPAPPIDPNLPPEERPLTPTEMLFVRRYLISSNASRAYQEVHQCAYSTAKAEGCRMLERPNVAREVRDAVETLLHDIDLKKDDVIQELIRVAFSDLVCVEDVYGGFLSLSQIPLQERRAIQSVKARIRTIPVKNGPSITETTIEYKLHKKGEALGLLASYLGIRKTGIPDLEAFLNLLPDVVEKRLRTMLAEGLAEQQAKANSNGHINNLPSTSPVAEAVETSP